MTAAVIAASLALFRSGMSSMTFSTDRRRASESRVFFERSKWKSGSMARLSTAPPERCVSI
jgi:hypothetical protein